MAKIATRESFGQALLKLAESDKKIVVLDADLCDATKTKYVKERLPMQFIECGIAEANMTSVAAGLATTGLIPFISSFAMFAAGRAYEQIRNSIGYPHLNVKICATHAGISVGEDGASHQCIEDIALMRAIPGMVVLSPSDDYETRLALVEAYKYNGPVYLRLSRLETTTIHKKDYSFKIGKGEIIEDGNDVAIISTGIMVSECLKAARMLKDKNIKARIVNICSIKPIDEHLLIDCAKQCGAILCVEEHSVIGGLGEAVSSVISEKHPSLVKKIGLNDVFGHSGKAEDLLVEYGLTAENIAKEALILIEKKIL